MSQFLHDTRLAWNTLAFSRVESVNPQPIFSQAVNFQVRKVNPVPAIPDHLERVDQITQSQRGQGPPSLPENWLRALYFSHFSVIIHASFR